MAMVTDMAMVTVIINPEEDDSFSGLFIFPAVTEVAKLCANGKLVCDICECEAREKGGAEAA